jgi:hypothetical protein
MPGPDGVGAAILELVDAEQPPLRVLFGEHPTQWVLAAYEQRLGLGRSGRTCPRSPKVRSGRRSRDSSGAHTRTRHVDHAPTRVLVERVLLTRCAADHQRLDVGIGDVASHRSSFLSVGEHLALDAK